MKQVAQNYKSGELTVLDVPVPGCRPGGVLVRSLHSLISTGTEVMKVSEASMSLVGKARARPDQVRKVLDSVAQQGVRAAYAKAMNRLDSYTPLGYSLCGVVVECGAGVEGLSPGRVVACAGNEYALHAEVNWVPRNLCVPVPDSVDPRLAAFATVGAIAMHGVRRSEAQLGDTACVVGLGLVGQLVVQLLVAAGVRVVGLDVVPARGQLAEKAGALACATPDDLDRLERVLDEISGGLGADHVLLVAGGSSNGPVEAAARLARDRARVVDVGKLKMDLPWNAYYEKELEVRFSRSYGPGRYDATYEVDGIDYPAGYVRWTERRNLECFLDLLARGALPVELLVSGSFPVTEAPQVYAGLRSRELDGVGYLFDYPGADLARPAPRAAPAASRPPVERRPGHVAVGFLGAGNYASSMLLPHLAGRPDVTMARVATTTSLSAANAQRRFGFADTSTDADAVLCDPSIDAVFVVTRHHSHADLVCRALEAGKATFVEKPLALSEPELERILAVVQATGNDRLMVGFNRRFAPLLVELRDRFGAVSGDAVLRYRVNAGPMDPSSWYADAGREGSRFVGEGGHFLDVAGWWLGARPEETFALPAGRGDGLHASIRFDDGSTAAIDYLANGNPRCPKEAIELSAGGRTLQVDNFRRATLWTGRRRQTVRARGAVDKGQRAQLASFLDAVRSGGPMPIPLSSLVATTRATLAVQRSLEEVALVRVA